MQPSIFISHGSPMLAIQQQPARQFLIELGRELAEPSAILVASAHFETAHPTLTETVRPDTIHDFLGFPPELYDIRYPAPGAPEIAQDIVNTLRGAGIDARTSHRGLDHGAWVPLMLMYPKANVPVVELSVMVQRTPEYHFRIGQALRELRSKNILIVGSGGATHNLHEYFRGHSGSLNEDPAWLGAFEEWLHEKLSAGEVDELLHYRERAPFAHEAHPTEEHFLPLFVAMGAGTTPQGNRIHMSRDRILTMDAYRFD